MSLRLAAFVLALAAAAPAAAFVRSTDATTDACLFWTRRELHWTLNEKGSADVPLADLEAALDRSFGAWQAVACADVTFAFDGLTPRFDAGFDPARSDNVNLLVWREKSCQLAAPLADACFKADNPLVCADKFDCWNHSSGVIALTTTNYNRNTGVIVDADIEFNGSPDAGGNEFRFTATVADGPPCAHQTDPGCVATDVQNTATHEIGHVVGLAHSPAFDATMFASAPLGETRKRSLDQDDIDGLCAIYPKGLPPVTCTPAGRITIAPAPATGCLCASPGAGGELVLLGLFARLRPRRRLAPNA